MRTYLEQRMGPFNRTATGCIVAAVVIAVLMQSGVGPAHAMRFSPWAAAVNAEAIPGTSEDLNTEFLDGCPIQSPDGLSLYMASNRPGPGSQGGIDIWVAHRDSTADPWGEPVNLGAPVNSEANDFCPTPVRGKGLFFVSTRSGAGSCGGADIYFARNHPAHGWSEPEPLACADGGPNTAGDEFSPSYFESGGREFLYFSSGPNIYVSERGADGRFGAGTPVDELNSGFDDRRPNVRKDGLEIVFDSNRPERSFGGFDIWTATRSSIDEQWSGLDNLGENVNSASNETRASLSWDGGSLYFGSNRPGGDGDSDIYVTTREKVTGRR